MLTADPARPSTDVVHYMGNLIAAEQQKRYGEYVKLIRQITPLLIDIAQVIESDWFDLSDEEQKLSIELKMMLDEATRKTGHGAPGFSEFVGMFGKWPIYAATADRLRFSFSAQRLSTAINQALLEEQRRCRLMDEKVANDPVVAQAIQIGEREFRERSSHRSRRFSRQDLLNRSR